MAIRKVYNPKFVKFVNDIIARQPKKETNSFIKQLKESRIQGLKCECRKNG